MPALAPPTPAVLGQRLDAFIRRCTPTFQTDEGSVTLPIPFRMNVEYSDDGGLVKSNASALVSAGRRIDMTAGTVALVKAGRGTPEQLTRLTQELIHEGRLPAPTTSVSTLVERIRAMMFAHGLGMDCASYAQQAFLASHGTTRAGSGLRPPLLENLWGLGARGFKAVPLGGVRTGDFIIFKAPPAPRGVEAFGHAVIVREAHPTTVEELEGLASQFARQSEPGPHLGSPGWTTIEVDSSWGSGGNPQVGGVGRQTLWHNDTAGWIWSDKGRLSAGAEYARHPLDGAYRARGR